MPDYTMSHDSRFGPSLVIRLETTKQPLRKMKLNPEEPVSKI